MQRPLNYATVPRSASRYKGLSGGLGYSNEDVALSPTYNVYDWLTATNTDPASTLTLQFPYGTAIQSSLENNRDIMAAQVPGTTTLGFPYMVGGTGVAKGSGVLGMSTNTLLMVGGGVLVLLLLMKKR